MKNILFIYPFPFHPEKGGIERVSAILIRGFKEKGFQVFALHYGESVKGLDLYSSELEIPCFCLPDKELNTAGNIRYYKKLLRENKIQILINQRGLFEESYFFLDHADPEIRKISVFHSPLDCMEKIYQQRKKESPSTNWFSDARSFLSKYWEMSRIHQVRKKHYQTIYAKSDKLVLLSTGEKELFGRYVEKKDYEKLTVIPNPNSSVEVDAFSCKKKQVLFVGRLVPEKGLDLLLDVWREVSERTSGWKLLIIGDGPLRAGLEAGIYRYALKNVELKGFQDPKPYYRESSILCMTSIYEGWGMVLTEAMQHKTVPIAFDSFSAAREIITDNQTGFLVKPFSVKEYGNKLARLIEHPEWRETIAENGKKEVTRFNADRIIDTWILLF